MAQQDRFKEKTNNNKVNIDYLSKDFSSFKNNLINLAKSYFPNTYNDFNETSPGMMLMEMSAYVGDVLSYYIDHQFKEMMLPLSEEKRNVINIANMLGYKVKSTVPAVVELEFRQTIPDDGSGDDPRKPKYTELMTFDRGLRVKSSTNSDVFFETLDSVDFSITGSGETAVVPIGQDEYGLTNLWEVTRNVMAVSGQTKSVTFNITNPKQFMELTISDDNVINIESVVDSNGRNWIEVDYLAQDRILSGSMRSNAQEVNENIPTKYELGSTFISDRRFITRVNEDNTTTLIFGNGVLSNKYDFSRLYGIWQENEDINSLIQGNVPSSVSPLFNSAYNSTLGESPAHTTLTVEYRVGGGIKANVSSNDLSSIVNASSKVTGNKVRLTSLSVNNNKPARGGNNSETIGDIKERAKAFFSSQNRSVTAQDYESRIAALPSSYGSVAKVYVNRATQGAITNNTFLSTFDLDSSGVVTSADTGSFETTFGNIMDAGVNDAINVNQSQIDKLNEINTWIGTLGTGDLSDLVGFRNINSYVLSYDSNKNLVKSTIVIKDNIKNYLSNYKVLSDEVNITDGVVINFGVKFIVEAHNNANKADIKLKCIDEIMKYFNNDVMQFNQIIYTSDLENVLYNSIGGIKVIHELFLTQDANDLNISTHLHATVDDGTGVVQSGIPADGVSGPTQDTYGHAYITEFKKFYSDYYGAGTGVILPPNSQEVPGVFELKNPLDNIKGVVI